MASVAIGRLVTVIVRDSGTTAAIVRGSVTTAAIVHTASARMESTDPRATGPREIAREAIVTTTIASLAMTAVGADAIAGATVTATVTANPDTIVRT